MGHFLCLHIAFIIAVMLAITGVYSDCNVSNNGLSVSCNKNGANIDMDLKLCRKVPKIHFKIDVDDLGVHIDESYGTNADIPLGGLGKLRWSLKPIDKLGTMKMKIEIVAFLIPIPVYSARVADPDCNPLMFWFNSQGIAVLIAIGAGALVLLSALVICCYCCCCRRQKVTGRVIISNAVRFSPPFNEGKGYMIHENVPI